MSIQSEIERINSNVQSTLSVIAETGVQTGVNSDALPAAASALANEKQDKLTGTAGQVVGFDENGNAVAQTGAGNGVYVGETEPTDSNITVWINPNGEADKVEALTAEQIRAICT